MVSKVHVWLGISHVDDEIADPYDHQYKVCHFADNRRQSDESKTIYRKRSVMATA
ncbi:hypothetical protein [Lysinibacillus sp. RC79]|uniref:hypothetical protein n=1 Tax=Lysinibacillus sp. RC79 TaxID=3156296 RepID=UPI003511193F